MSSLYRKKIKSSEVNGFGSSMKMLTIKYSICDFSSCFVIIFKTKKKLCHHSKVKESSEKKLLLGKNDHVLFRPCIKNKSNIISLQNIVSFK